MACVAWAAAAIRPEVGWLPDLMASFAAQGAAVCGVTGMWWLIRRRGRRRWISGVIAALTAAVLGGAVAVAPRARSAAGPADLTLMIYNALGPNAHPDAAFDEVMKSGAGVVILIEPPMPMYTRLQTDAAALAAYPYRATRGWTPTGGSHQTVLSRWPLRAFAPAPTPEPPAPGPASSQIVPEILVDPTQVLAVAVEVPADSFGSKPGPELSGTIGLVVLHADSPRTPARWRRGNAETSRALDAARALIDRGLPVIVAGDLNAAPTSARSRSLISDGRLRCAKPIRAGGSFPAWLPGPMRVAIDQAFVTREFEVVSWRLGGAGGSDHRPVIIGLARRADAR